MSNVFTWARLGGYEVSSKADKRFSAFYAIMPDGRSIECHYQCCVKCYDPGGTNWQLGKGKKGLDPTVDLWSEYLNLWRIWANNHLDLMRQLYIAASPENVLSDRYASTPINQARALSCILNELIQKGKQS
jgi:hypothetical protein